MKVLLIAKWGPGTWSGMEKMRGVQFRVVDRDTELPFTAFPDLVLADSTADVNTPEEIEYLRNLVQKFQATVPVVITAAELSAEGVRNAFKMVRAADAIGQPIRARDLEEILIEWRRRQKG